MNNKLSILQTGRPAELLAYNDAVLQKRDFKASLQIIQKLSQSQIPGYNMSLRALALSVDEA